MTPAGIVRSLGVAAAALVAIVAVAHPAGRDDAAGSRPRVVVSTDIGGTDPDDCQSMVHLRLYADVLDLEGLISSPYGPGRREHVLQVIDRYAIDYPSLKAHSPTYPEPDRLRRIAKEGALDRVQGRGVAGATEGSTWIVEQARRADSRPLHVLVWGGLEDVAQALHDAPDIVPKLRVDFIGGNQAGEWGNRSFVATHVVGHGTLGDVPGLDGRTGQFSAVLPPLERTRQRSGRHPHWWADDPEPSAAEGIHAGARSVSRWREEFLRGLRSAFSARRHPPPAGPEASRPPTRTRPA